MAKMTKKFEKEFDFFMKKGLRRRVCYCDACKKCIHDCKQSYKIIDLACPYISTK